MSPTDFSTHTGSRFCAFKTRAPKPKYDLYTSLIKAFSLIELLLVIAIIGILVTLATPAIQSIAGGNAIMRSADQIAGAINLARQTAVAKNRRVEIRFYDMIPPSGGSTTQFCAFQVFEIDDSGVGQPVSRVTRLPDSTIISKDSALSTLLDSTRNKTWNSNTESKPSVSGVGTSYTARFVTFRPNGTTDLPIDKKWHLTVVDANFATATAATLKNLACIWINPANGTTKILRP